MTPLQTRAYDMLIVRRKSQIPEDKNYNKWESLLTPGHWVAISMEYIQRALDAGYHVLWNPETQKKRVLSW